MKTKIIGLVFVIVVAVGVYGFSLRQTAHTPVSSEGDDDAQKLADVADDTDQENVIYYKTITGYLATPHGTGPHPAIILIHEWWGLNDDIKDLAQRYADAGYVALTVDLYNGQNTTDPAVAQKFAGEVRGSTEEAFNNLRGAVEYLRARPDVDGDRLASVGWCFGGGWSYQMAVGNLGTKASVMYYGQFDPHDDFVHMRSAILGHFGEKDASIKVDNVREFQAQLKTASGAHEVYVYPNVGHGFANARGGTNVAYSAEAADQAWERTMIFLTETLK
ncbi:MAG: hypothetical protein A3C84_04265 [Candidatus Ryanbacteria bacterium RIFCSPHIGHO2_02_FULL_48_12]|uniref:Dienelactone hydrolase domain-containing protein n=1 Tax=Candidatus Ryanbacteria bacterium RIFCSPHIGHO2_01_FULL_48_27 TaxID=1802115 RepID=A0A1G2G6I7_9BACT|nr:MAG: hypothetical protein A2756_00690 [Candidatus Ryanbacteria bacterium RIFCSPHIGHO2_01_FULL_48_27]OGZ48578.1 MAG: hypothetical protein A3C84_04265 [Candidatus Ryanbacteria bacterium RIFCSPHIGHO2_02_FULL_48_12]